VRDDDGDARVCDDDARGTRWRAFALEEGLGGTAGRDGTRATTTDG